MTERRNPKTPSDTIEDPPLDVRPVDVPWHDRFEVRLGAVMLLALVLRGLHTIQTQVVPSAVNLIGDAAGYFQWGTRISDGDWYGQETFYQAPLYPYFLAVLFSVTGPSVIAIRLAQAVLGTIGVGLIGATTRSYFGERTGLVAAVMLAILPSAVYYDGLVQKASLASFLLCLFLFWITLRTERNAWRWLAAGVTLGLLMLVRENTLLWVPLPLVWIAWSSSRWKTGSIHGLAYLAGILLVLFPVAARNASLGGEWSPTTFQAGPNFYIGNNLGASGVYSPLVPGHETPLHERSDAVQIAEQTSGRELTSREVSRFWFEQSWSDIKADPSRWFQLLLVKTLMVVNYFEVPDVESMRVYRDYSSPLMVLDRVWHFGIVLTLATLGLVFTRDRLRVTGLLLAMIVVLAAATAAFFILGRYRFPLTILLIPLAAAGLIESIGRIRAGHWRRLRWPAVVALIVAVVAHLPVHDVRTLNASSFGNVGAALAQNGDINGAIVYFRRAIGEAPDLSASRVNLGRALMMRGQLGEAIDQFRIALQLEPDLVDVDFYLATALEQTGRLREAAFHYQRASVRNPGDPRIEAARQRIDGMRP